MKKFFIFIFCVFLFIGKASAAEFYFDLNKKQYSYDDLVKSPKTVLFIWATWCPSCRSEISRIAKDPSLMEKANIVFLSIGEPSSDVSAVVERLKLPEPIRQNMRLDPFENIANRFYVSSVPTVVYLDKGVPVRTAHSVNHDILSYVYPQEGKMTEQVGEKIDTAKPAGNVISASQAK